jgi:neutral ceramidase
MIRFVATFALFLSLALPMVVADEPTFLAGFAEKDITPEIGMEAPGGYGKAYHQTLHDPCKVRAAVFDDGKSMVAIVGIDAIGIRRESVQRVRKRIFDKTGIPEAHQLFNASHSHSSGPLAWIMPGEFDYASPLVQKLAYKESTCVDPKYLEKSETAIVEAVIEAHAKRQVSNAGVGKGTESQVAFNRRFKMRSGYTMTHPGLGNPEIIEPAGPVDPEVGVIGAWDVSKEPSKKEKLLGCVVNFSCHATTNPGGISANYVYYLEKVIQGYYGKDCVVVFIAGASGDVTQVNNQSETQHPAAERWAEKVGGRIGAEAVKVLISMERGSLAPLGAKTKVWQVPRRLPKPEKVKAALAMVEANDPKVPAADKTFAKETVLLDALIQKDKNVEVEVQAVQVGPAVFVTDPAEYFCEYGLQIKAGSGFPFTFPASLTNGCVGYVPTKAAFAADGGGYETRLTSYSNLEITAGDQIRDVGIELAKQLKPGAVPVAPKRLPFTGKPWDYGSVRPEVE